MLPEIEGGYQVLEHHGNQRERRFHKEGSGQQRQTRERSCMPRLPNVS